MWMTIYDHYNRNDNRNHDEDQHWSGVSTSARLHTVMKLELTADQETPPLLSPGSSRLIRSVTQVNNSILHVFVDNLSMLLNLADRLFL